MSISFVYQLTTNTASTEGVQLQHMKVKGMKRTPGVSSFVSHVEDIGAYLLPLFVNAATVVPPEHHATTEVHILGTAGNYSERSREGHSGVFTTMKPIASVR